MAFKCSEYLTNFHQGYNKNYRSETWTVTLTVTRTLWDTDGWASMPARGSAPPADPDNYPVGLAVGGTLLDIRLDFKTEPGFVIVYLIYGYAFTERAINKGYIIGRTIMVEEKVWYAYTDATPPVKTQVVGPKAVANGKTVTQEYDITPGAGYDLRRVIPFQLVRIHAYLDKTGLDTYVGGLLNAAGRLNEEVWTLLGKEISIEQMRYQGANWGFYRALSEDEALYTADFDFLIHPYTWQKVLRRTLYDIGTGKFPVWDADGAKIGEKVVKARKVAASGNETVDYDMYLTHDFATTLGPLLT